MISAGDRAQGNRQQFVEHLSVAAAESSCGQSQHDKSYTLDRILAVRLGSGAVVHRFPCVAQRESGDLGPETAFLRIMDDSLDLHIWLRCRWPALLITYCHIRAKEGRRVDEADTRAKLIDSALRAAR